MGELCVVDEGEEKKRRKEKGRLKKKNINKTKKKKKKKKKNEVFFFIRLSFLFSGMSGHQLEIFGFGTEEANPPTFIRKE